ncbi:MauE/DoxX family redox-associated membrane protein [Streptomyces johnsoniae]|uniref:Methylamine utilisation protein MauE domain-containing protein n=1 Tax=Streptomyces johnsoniae TaxID=3075532 RepID=A0ABU2S369_9ACTN|nr:MauE/DoxX family redox-associated membrane protein [Streptomyces sp. DSM 41886]MDT0443438.1 hypothetical protein [Streptomyces sp. DSM 41886]
MQYLDLGARVLVGVIFATALISKLGAGNFRAFTVSTGALLPYRFYRHRRALAIGYVVCEILIVVMLTVPTASPWGLALAAATLLLLAAFIARSMRSGDAVACRCFGGASRTPLGRPHLARNVALAALAAVAAAAAWPSGAGSELSLAPAVPVVGAALLLGVLVVRLDDLVVLLGPTARTASSARSSHAG